MMYRGMGVGRDDGRNRGPIGRSPPRRRRTPEDENKFCIYCKVQVSSARLYEEHKSSAVHKQKEILIGKALSDGLQYCYTCEKIFPSKLALDAHCLMTRHKPLYRVDELQELISKTANANNLVQIQRPPESRRAREEKERQDIVTKLNEVRGGDATEEKIVIRPNEVIVNKIETDNNHVEPKDFFCEVCNVDCNNYSNYKIHSESWRHRSEVDKKKDEEKQKFDKEAEKEFNAAEEVERKKVPAHLTGKAGYFCEVCSIASVSEPAYIDHLRTRKHFRQVGQMRRPYKCYFCEVEFNVAKDFNYHLESRTHMDKAFNKEKKIKKREKDDEWVEKKTDRGREHREKDGNRDVRKDDRNRRTWHNEKDERRDRRPKDEKKDTRKAEIKETVAKHTDGRKVEIVDVDNPVDTGIKDLREKLKAQKNIIITKPNSPERVIDEKSEESQPPEEEENNRSELLEIEKEFDAKFEALIKEYEDNHAGLQEQLTRDREEDINAYQKYEDDFKELKEEEDFIRGNIDKLDDDDPCKQDYIIDIIRVQRKMEEVRQQLEVKEMTIIKRENSYRKYFPEVEEKQESAATEPTNTTYTYDYNHGGADKEEDNAAQNVTENRVSPENSNSAELSGTDLRIKLERERLLKRLGPELESVDPSLREKLLSVIFEKDKEGEKHSKESKSGDTRQVVKDDDLCMRELTKREKQLEIELANLKSADKKKKKNLTKSLVPQYDDVDEKKKETKKRTRKRSVSSSSSSRSSSSSSDSSYCRNKRKRKSSPSKSRLKSKRSGSSEKIRRKRRSRSISREREKRKRIAVKKVKDDEKKKRADRSKVEKKKTDKVGVQSTNKVNKTNDPSHEDNDSDVQVITPPAKAQPISVLGSTSAAPPINMCTSQVIPSVTSTPQSTTTSNLPPQRRETSTSHHPPQRREQFSFWKNPVVAQPAPKDSPKEDIWDSAFSGGQKEEVTGSATLNLFDPSGGAQLPEDILNILKSVAPIINQHQSTYKQPTSRMTTTSNTVNTHPSNPYNSISNSPRRENLQTSPNKNNNKNNNEIKQDDKGGDTTRIRSILKKGNDHVSSQSVQVNPSINNLASAEIPGLDSSANLDHPPPAPPRRTEHVGRSILKPQSDFKDHHIAETSKPTYYDNAMYSTSDENGRRELNDHSAVKDEYGHIQHSTSDTRDVSNTTYARDSHYDNRNMDSEDKERPYESQMDYMRQVPPPSVERRDPYNDIDAYRQPPPMERDRPDHMRSPRVESRSPTMGRPPAETYDSERNLRQDRDPYMRSEVTHRVIDYSYVRDTRVIAADNHTAPPTRYDDNLRQPVRYPGETDDEYYARFERFYELNRRNEERVDRDPPRRLDGGRLNPEGRVPTREDLYAQTERKDRYDDRLSRPPHADNYARPRGVADHDRIPPLSSRVIDESVRRIERIPYQEEGRGPPPYQKVVEITKRVEDKSVRDSNNAPYRWNEMVDNRLPNDAGRNTRNDNHLPIRDNSRDFESRGMRNTLPRLPPPRVPPLPRLPGLSRPRLPRPPPVADYENKFQDY